MAKRSKRNPPRNNPAARQPRLNQDFLWDALLFAAVFLAYSPVWRAGFIWDDGLNITANPCIVGPLGLKEIWTTNAAQFYPLVLTTFWVEHALWGLAPLPYHLVNVFIHGACAIVLCRVLRKLPVPGAWFGAALWALHPVQVESVAWVTELKNTESTLFFLLSILFFARHLRSQNVARTIGWDWNYALTMLFAVLAILSKSSTVILPLVLCLCAWWVEGRWHWRTLIKVAPIVPASIAASALTVWTQVLSQSQEAQAALDPRRHTWPAHIVSAGEGFWFYLGKLVWPHPLMTLYPMLEVNTGEPLSYLPFLAIGILLIVLWWKRKSWARPWFFAFAYFLVAMLPELEFAGWYIGDHFQYLGSMGPLALAGAGIAQLTRAFASSQRWLPSACAAGLLLLLGFLSWRHCRAYESSEALWIRALRDNPGAWMAHYALGHIRLHQGRLSEAIQEYTSYLRLSSHDPEVVCAKGAAEEGAGDWDQAIADFRLYGKIAPKAPNANYAHLWIWVIRAQQHEQNEADQELASSLSGGWTAAPDAWVTKDANFLLGRMSETDYFAAAASTDPEDDRGRHCEAYYYAGMKRLLAGDKGAAIDYLQKSVATGETEYLEWVLAQAELNSLNAGR